MEALKNDDNAVDPEDNLEETDLNDQNEDPTDGYHKFLAEMVLFGNLADKIDDNKFPILSKMGLAIDPQVLASKKTGEIESASELESKYTKNEKPENVFLKSLAQNSDRFGEFNIQNFLDSKREALNSKIAVEMKNYELDIDFGTYEFQRKFYAKYILVNNYRVQSELEKSEQVKIKVVISDQNRVFLTRSRMDALLSEFKQIYRSFCKLKGFLTQSCLQKFDSIFEFFDFVLMQEIVLETFEIKENENDFEIKWKKQEVSKYFQKSDEFIDQDFFKDLLISYFRQNVFESIKKITDSEGITDQKILAFLIKQHNAFFEYMLKYEKQNKETEVQREKMKN